MIRKNHADFSLLEATSALRRTSAAPGCGLLGNTPISTVIGRTKDISVRRRRVSVMSDHADLSRRRYVCSSTHRIPLQWRAVRSARTARPARPSIPSRRRDARERELGMGMSRHFFLAEMFQPLPHGRLQQLPRIADSQGPSKSLFAGQSCRSRDLGDLFLTSRHRRVMLRVPIVFSRAVGSFLQRTHRTK